jgi:hypothetical protein
MKLTTTAGLALLVAPVALLGVYLASPPSPFHGPLTLALGLVLVGLLELVLLTCDRRSAPFDILIAGLVCVFFLLRLPVLWLAPDQFVYPGTIFGPRDLPLTLAFLIAGLAAAVAGFRLGAGWTWRPRRRSRHDHAPLLRTSMVRVLIVGASYFAIEVGLWMYAGLSSALSPDAPTGPFLFLRHFISLYAAVGISLVAAVDRWPRLSLLNRLLFLAFIGLFLVYTLAGGSRSGLVTLVIAFVLYLLIRRGDFRISLGFMSGMAAAVTVSVMLFPAATLIRHAWLSASEAAQGQLSADSPLAAPDSWLLSGVLGGLNRLNGLDPLLMIVSRKEAIPVSEVVSAGQMARSAVNLIVPSVVLGREPFPGVLPSSRLFSAVYRGRSAEFIASWYQTDMFTLWGTAFALGGWAAGPLVMVAVGLFLGFGYRRIVRRGGAYNVLLRLWWLYACYLVIISFGFDVDFAAAVYIFLGGAVVVLLLRPRSSPATTFVNSQVPPLGSGRVLTDAEP